MNHLIKHSMWMLKSLFFHVQCYFSVGQSHLTELLTLNMMSHPGSLVYHTMFLYDPIKTPVVEAQMLTYWSGSSLMTWYKDAACRKCSFPESSPSDKTISE